MRVDQGQTIDRVRTEVTTATPKVFGGPAGWLAVQYGARRLGLRCETHWTRNRDRREWRCVRWVGVG